MDQLEAGMVLSGDVTNLNKEVLLAKGTVLTDGFLRTLKMWGIRSANVAVEQEEAGPLPQSQEPSAPHLVSAAEQHVNHRFKHVKPCHPVVETIRALAIKRKCASLTKTSPLSSRP